MKLRIAGLHGDEDVIVLNKKKQRIIEAAIKCFAQKGFHATSIQDIVDEIGIAKGSVYIYFKSKEELLASALKYILQQFVDRVSTASNDPALAAAERLHALLKVQLEFSTEHRSFIMMIMNESALRINEEIRGFMLNFRVEYMKWLHATIIEMYGEEVGEYGIDAASIMQAIGSHYMSHLIFDQVEVPTDLLVRFLIERLDDIVKGMRMKGDSPILTEQSYAQWVKNCINAESDEEKWTYWITQIRNRSGHDIGDVKKREELLSYLLVLENELSKERPVQAVVQSMLDYINELELAGMKESIDKLETAAMSRWMEK